MGQNIQLHYDFGRHLYPQSLEGRPYLMTTLEQKTIDKFGDTFYFVDMTYLNQGGVSANWKFLRNLRFWQAPISWHVRYDGGLRFVNANAAPPVGSQAISFNDSFFTGVTYHWKTADRRLIINATLSYKYIKKHPSPHNWEAVAVWNYSPRRRVFNATGFAEVWQERDFRFATRYKFMSQPQFWLNLDKVKGFSPDLRLSVGSEVRISNNIDKKGWAVIPTLALKWSFGQS